MRALVPLLIIGGAALVGIRLYYASKQDLSDATRARQIIWKIIDIFLILIAAVAAVALVIFLVTIIGQMVQNLT